MRTVRDALTQYIAARRALGSKLREPAVTLGRFVEFVERERGSGVHHHQSRSALGVPIGACATSNMGTTTWPGETVRFLAERIQPATGSSTKAYPQCSSQAQQTLHLY